MINLAVSTSHNSPATNYKIIDETTGRDNVTGKRLQLIAYDNTVLFDSGENTDININEFNVAIDASWITTLAILSVQVFLTYNVFGGTTAGPLQQNYALPTISNLPQ